MNSTPLLTSFRRKPESRRTWAPAFAGATTLGLLLLLTGSPLNAKPEAMFSSRGGIQRRLVSTIDHAQHTIDLAMFDLTAESVLQALRRAGTRGVSVRLVLDARIRKEHGRDDVLKGTPNLVVRAVGGRTRGRGLMHNKFAIIDSTTLITGSYNWTQNAEHANYENALFLDDPEVISAYKDEFSRLWEAASRPSPARAQPRHRSLRR